MTRTLIAYAVCALIGVVGCWWVMSASVREWQGEHAKAVALGQDYRAERDAHHRAAVDAMNTADSLRRIRPEVRARVIAAPDSVAAASGIVLTTPDSMTRCIPLADLAALLADRAELDLTDSAAKWDAISVSACLEALAYSDSAEAVARNNALRLYTASEALVVEVGQLRRARWWWAAGGAAGGILLVMGIGAAL